MGAKKITKIDLTKLANHRNSHTTNNEFPKLEIINEKFTRSFRQSISKYIRTITNITYKTDKLSLKQWQNENPNHNCMFILRSKSLNSSILIKMDRVLSYGVIDILTGGTGVGFESQSEKEITSLELSILKNLGQIIMNDLNFSWEPVFDLKLEFVRAEVNSTFIGITATDSQLIRVSHETQFNTNQGTIEIIYPYSSLFPIRDQLFSI